MLPGEALCSGAPDACPDCGKEVVWHVRTNGPSNCVATYCNCGMYSRESMYTNLKEEAERWLELINSQLLRGAQYTDMPELFTFIRR